MKAPTHLRKLFSIILGLVVCAINGSATTLLQTYDGITSGSEFLHVSRRHNANPEMWPWTGDRKAISFTTDASSYQLDSATLSLTLAEGASSDFLLGLYGDNSGHPGSSLFSFFNPGNFGVSSPSSYASNVTFVAVGMVLSPNTTYWIVAEPSLASSSYFLWSSGSSGFGYDTSPIQASSGNAWENWTTESGASPAIVLHATAVPEPSMVAMALVGICACRAVQNRRR